MIKYVLRKYDMDCIYLAQDTDNSSQYSDRLLGYIQGNNLMAS